MITIEELKTLIESNPDYDGCAIELPSGKLIGTTSGGFLPLLYKNTEDIYPCLITWEEAATIYSEEN